MGHSFIETAKEFNKILSTAHGSTELEISADIIQKILNNEILKDAPFKITLFEDGQRYEYEKHIYKIVKGQEISSTLYEYMDDKYRFTFDILGNN